MITKVEALGYRCLKYVSQDLDRFHILVGPNASGKSTLDPNRACARQELKGGAPALVSLAECW